MLRDKVVVITGGAGLIGQEFVRAVVENSGIPIIADKDSIIGQQAKSKLCQELNTENIGFENLDITSKASILSVLNDLDKRYGRIDALVNNAYPRNKNYGRHFFDVEYVDFCENVNMNLGGYFLTSQLFAAYFKTRGCGNIINISSIYGIIPPKFEVYHNTSMTMPVEYAAFKAGINNLTKYMAKYFKGLNIRVNSISPGGILDDQPEAFLDAYRNQSINKGMLDKSDMRGTLIYLLSDMSAYVNGQNIVIDDGFSL